MEIIILAKLKKQNINSGDWKKILLQKPKWIYDTPESK